MNVIKGGVIIDLKRHEADRLANALEIVRVVELHLDTKENPQVTMTYAKSVIDEIGKHELQNLLTEMLDALY